MGDVRDEVATHGGEALLLREVLRDDNEKILLDADNVGAHGSAGVRRLRVTMRRDPGLEDALRPLAELERAQQPELGRALAPTRNIVRVHRGERAVENDSEHVESIEDCGCSLGEAMALRELGKLEHVFIVNGSEPSAHRVVKSSLTVYLVVTDSSPSAGKVRTQEVGHERTSCAQYFSSR